MWTRAIVLILLSCSVPLRAADWEPIGPGGGSPDHVTADPLVPGRLFAVWSAGELSEVYRRDAGAASWSLANRGLENVRPERLAFHPARPGTLWAATQGPLSIYRSTDAGVKWQRRFLGRRQDQAFGLWSVPREGEAALLGWFGVSTTTAKLFRSGNGGATWKAVAGARGPVAVLPGASTAFALGANGRSLLVSQNAGATWKPNGVLPVDTDVDPVRSFIAIPGKRGRGPVLIVSFAQAGVFRSADRGVTWSLVGLAAPSPSPVVAAPRAVFALFETGLHRSADGGATWLPRPSASFPEGEVSLVANPSTGALYAVKPENDEIFQSSNGGSTWTHVAPRGVQQFVTLDFAWHPLDPRVQAIVSGTLTPAGTGLEKVEIQWTVDGATWRKAPFWMFTFDPMDPHVLYAGWSIGVSVSRDGGATWTSLRSKAASTLAHTGEALFAGGCGIARSEDGGGHWTEVLPCDPPPSPLFPNGGQLMPTRFIPHPTDPDILWAEVLEYYRLSDGHLEGRNAFYSSYDGGDTWDRQAGFGRIALAPGQPDTVWMLAGTLQRSDDRGLTWRVVRSLISENTYDLVIDPFDADQIYLVGSFAERSMDGGATWHLAFDVAKELAPWGSHRQQLTRLYLHPTLPGRIAAAPPLGLLLRRAPL